MLYLERIYSKHQICIKSIIARKFQCIYWPHFKGGLLTYLCSGALNCMQSYFVQINSEYWENRAPNTWSNELISENKILSEAIIK